MRYLNNAPYLQSFQFFVSFKGASRIESDPSQAMKNYPPNSKHPPFLWIFVMQCGLQDHKGPGSSKKIQVHYSCKKAPVFKVSFLVANLKKYRVLGIWRIFPDFIATTTKPSTGEKSGKIALQYSSIQTPQRKISSLSPKFICLSKSRLLTDLEDPTKITSFAAKKRTTAEWIELFCSVCGEYLDSDLMHCGCFWQG